MTASPDTRRILPGLMVPFFSLIFHLSTFLVAVPTIREEFALAADTTSWLLLIFTIPYILFMPFYGRMADTFGTRTLMLIGVGVYAAGSTVCLVAPSMAFVFVGRFIQASGAACLNPLSLSIITRCFPPESRGRALGTWNATGPFTGTIGPVVGGFLIDAFGWRSVFLPVVTAAIVSVFIVRALIPPMRNERRTRSAKFDWPGMALTGIALTSFILFLSSRPVTGRAPFTDWRLLLVFLGSATGWFLWERSRRVPFVAVSLFKRRQFALAAICVSVRMFYLGTVNFLVPLYAADVLNADASVTGLAVAANAAALLLTMRLGGAIADRFSRRYPVRVGMFGQAAILFWFAVSPGDTVPWLIVPVVLHGALAGLSLASLHHIAMHEVPPEDSGAGAGTYSMSRFFGNLVGASLMGVVLEFWLRRAEDIGGAYRLTFLVAAVVGVIGSLASLLLRDTAPASETGDVAGTAQ